MLTAIVAIAILVFFGIALALAIFLLFALLMG